MKQIKKTVGVFTLVTMLAAGLLLPVGASAQQRVGGLFGHAQSPSDARTEGLFNTTNNRAAFDLNIQGMDNFGIGEEAPLGSGIALLLAAGLGYVALKKKED